MVFGVVPFTFEDRSVRVVWLDGQPTFIALDVCSAVEISKYRDAVAKLDADERVSVNVDTLGGRQMMTAVTQSGLFALIVMGKSEAARRFRKWVTSVVLPTLFRTGSYHLDSADAADLEVKRAYYRGLPDESRAKADHKAAAQVLIDAAVARGVRTCEAVRMVSSASGIAERTLWSHRRSLYMVARSDRAAAMAHKGHGRRGMLAPCHPKALALFLDLCGEGQKVSHAYARMSQVAAARGWSPVPNERTLRRQVERSLPRPSARKGRAA